MASLPQLEHVAVTPHIEQVPSIAQVEPAPIPSIPVEIPAEVPAEIPAVPLQVPVEIPVEAPLEVPVHVPVEIPAEVLIETPVTEVATSEPVITVCLACFVFSFAFFFC